MFYASFYARLTDLADANTRLKAIQAGCRIQLRGRSYALEATLPLRHGPGRRQQRITLGRVTLLEAERRALELSHQIRSDTFTWESWDQPVAPGVITVDAFRTAAQRLHASKYRNDPERGQKNWTKNWLPALRKLPLAGAVTEKTLLQVIARLPENGSARRNQGTILAQVAESLSIPTRRLRQACGGYGASQLSPRDIPEDGVIEATILGISAPHWRWCLGMLATYGLRPHELEEIQPGTDKTWIVADYTKTGSRQVHPCPSSWYEVFALGSIAKPPTSRQELSARLSFQLRRIKAPFTCYALRHAYAIRLMEKGVPPELGCRLMGHSLQTHETQYKRWLQRDRITRAMARFDL